ncbi:MAG: Prolipoprotein diacylglyceryl transferase [uncultured Thermomicrobiales bacterium]|uniref:Phosphatidylglycerol--prolipoprotein diacylglyceryl transferase n=1 Tax=uncultured Thermomicrobiales bacterium TaxID=1645740 RepID=A0A6J4VZA1_9BACT|nr:MAG: Prolipoprotein diacylglyceryl transferase [uncultured Thermomicrobiales bacterium]
MVTDPVAFAIGPLAVRWYGILIMLGVLGGATLAARLAGRKGENPDHLWNMVPLVVFVAIAGARIYWVMLDWQTCCAADPWQALNIRGGGISIHGAIAFGLLAIWGFTRFNKLGFFRWVDIIVPGMALGQAIGRWGNFTNQEAFGSPTTAPWGIFISPQRRPIGYENFEYFHPTFLYESIYNLLACIVLYQLAVRIDRDRRLRDGDTLWVYLIGYAVARFAIESLRTDSLLIGPFKAAHVISAILLIIGFVGLGWRHIGWRGEDKPRLAATTTAADTTEAMRVNTEEAPAQTPAHLVGKSVHARKGNGEPTARET